MNLDFEKQSILHCIYFLLELWKVQTDNLQE